MNTKYETTKNKYIPHAIILTALSFLVIAPANASEITVENVLRYVNEAREKEGAGELVINEKLMDAASGKLNDMVSNQYFAHTSPTGVSPWFWFEKSGYDYQYAGENLAINFMTAEAQHKAWMESPTHRKNILNPKYREIGIAVGAGKIDGETSIITVQEFGALPGAGEASSGKRFSVGVDSNLKKEQEEIVPQVLSVKDAGLKNHESMNSNAFQENKIAVIDLASAISALLLFVSLALAPLSFLSVAYEDIGQIVKRRKHSREFLM